MSYDIPFGKKTFDLRSRARPSDDISPTAGEPEDWAINYARALWLERWRLRNQAEMIAAMFGEKK